MPQNWTGVMATTFELQSFPFDHQSLWMVVNVLAWNRQQVQLRRSIKDKNLGIVGGASVGGFVVFVAGHSVFVVEYSFVRIYGLFFVVDSSFSFFHFRFFVFFLVPGLWVVAPLPMLPVGIASFAVGVGPPCILLASLHMRMSLLHFGSNG